MRNFNMLAALSAALLAGGGVHAMEKPDDPKPRKVCRTEQMPGRITPKRVCRVVSPPDSSAQDGRRKAADPRQPGNGRD